MLDGGDKTEARLREENLREQGRLKILRSELSRAKQGITVKAPAAMDENLREQEKTNRMNRRKLIKHDPETASKLKLDRLLPRLDAGNNSAFKSPSRT